MVPLFGQKLALVKNKRHHLAYKGLQSQIQARPAFEEDYFHSRPASVTLIARYPLRRAIHFNSSDR